MSGMELRCYVVLHITEFNQNIHKLFQQIIGNKQILLVNVRQPTLINNRSTKNMTNKSIRHWKVTEMLETGIPQNTANCQEIQLVTRLLLVTAVRNVCTRQLVSTCAASK